MSYKCIEVEAMIGGYEGSSDGYSGPSRGLAFHLERTINQHAEEISHMGWER